MFLFFIFFIYIRFSFSIFIFVFHFPYLFSFFIFLIYFRFLFSLFIFVLYSVLPASLICWFPASLAHGTSEASLSSPIVVCYFPSWAVYRTPPYKARDVDPRLCSHVVWAFAAIDENTLLLSPPSSMEKGITSIIRRYLF